MGVGHDRMTSFGKNLISSERREPQKISLSLHDALMVMKMAVEQGGWKETLARGDENSKVLCGAPDQSMKQNFHGSCYRVITTLITFGFAFYLSPSMSQGCCAVYKQVSIRGG